MPEGLKCQTQKGINCILILTRKSLFFVDYKIILLIFNKRDLGYFFLFL